MNSQIFKKKKLIIYGSIFFLIILGCNETFTPKPRGYFRISFPEKKYSYIQNNKPYLFELPDYADIEIDNPDSAWINIQFKQFNGTLHLTYYDIEGKSSNIYFEDSRTLAYKHTLKADAINEKIYINDSNKVYGILYEIQGNSASQIQFFATDSVKHFLRGALYFKANPNKDSLAPVVDFLKQDILVLIETLKWN